MIVNKLLWGTLQVLGFKRLAGHTIYVRHMPPRLSILDLGGNKGAFADAMSINYGLKNGVIVEANPVIAKTLEKRTDLKLQVLNAGLVGQSDKPLKFYVSENIEASSFCEEVAGCFGIKEVIDVPLINQEELWSRYKLGEIDIAKWDIEGAELDVIPGMSPDHLSAVRQMTVEFHDCIDPSQKPGVNLTRQLLKEQGFIEVNANHPWTDDILYLNNKFLTKLDIVSARIASGLLWMRGIFWTLRNR